ncbi:MAG TPA: hypothetical protein VMF65_15885 [Acidimicrobiales bacterium]|nr:hypothetical protein [Acidimicrobiales bacterium]
MPWCDDCSKFWNPPDMGPAGTCPSCRRVLVPGGGGEDGPGPAPSRNGTTSLTRAKGAPWHFKLMVLGVTGYMIYRIYWFIEWLPKHI